MSAQSGSFKRILVPVDLSPRSANALEYAVAFGSLQRAAIDVLHVWHSDLSTGVTAAKERAKSALREFVASLALHGDVALRRRTDHGDPYLTIQSVAQLSGHDLLVVAGPESQRMDHDSVAKSLLSSAPCAVLFVPPNSKPRRRAEQDRALDLERLLVPLALAGEELQALGCAEALVAAATIEVLSTSDASDQSRTRLRARPPYARREERQDPQPSVAAVQQRARLSACDLLVLCGKRAAIGERSVDRRHELIALSQPQPSLCLPG